MLEEAKFENAKKITGLIKWTISDFEANLPGVRVFSFTCYDRLLAWSASLSRCK